MRRVCWLGAVVLGFAVLGAGTTLQKFNFNDVALWVFGNLYGPSDVRWQRVQAAQFGGEPSAVRAFPSPAYALYFGKIVSGKGSYKDGANPVGGTATSPEVSLQLPGAPPATYATHIKISFGYLRVVEYFLATGYDQTTVDYSFDRGGTWTTLKQWTSKDPSEPAWKLFESDPIATGGAADVVMIRFTFDSVDGTYNEYLGWIVDDLTIKSVPAPLAIDEAQTQIALAGVVGTLYEWAPGAPAFVAAMGGTPPYTWSVHPAYPLPPGLGLRDTDVDGDGDVDGRIEGTPEKAGTYVVRALVKDAAGAVAHKDFKIKISDPGAFPGFLETFDAGLPAGWATTTGSLWHLTADVQVGGGNIITSAGAVYYGKDDTTTPNYNTHGVRNSGYLTSGRYDVTGLGGLQMVVSFDSWREVEHTTAGGYDRTFVEIRFDDGPWTRIWSLDSATPSSATWEPITIADVDGNPITVLPGANMLQIRFGFDTMDGSFNDFVGWLIDNLEIAFQPVEFEITMPQRPDLPPAEVGVPYWVKFEATGGVPPYAWSAESRIPSNLVLDRDTGILSGVPAAVEVGSHSFTIKVTDRNGATATKVFNLAVNRATTLFFEDFENGLAARWEEASLGLWHLTKQVKGVDLGQRGQVAYYGQNDAANPNYATGHRTIGYLTSKEFSLPTGTKGFKLSFTYWREVEYYAKGGYDRTYVEVRLKKADGSWTGWYVVWSKDAVAPSEKAWTPVEVNRRFDTVAPGATGIQIRFVFDSVDQYYNNYTGWLVDNVRVALSETGTQLSSMTLPTAPAREREQLSVFNYPNPVRDVHTTTFVVRGVEAEALRVEVYDLSGRLVYKAEVPGSELVWHTQDLLGRYLANGVYLYRAYVKVGGTWIASEVQKLVVLR